MRKLLNGFYLSSPQMGGSRTDSRIAGELMAVALAGFHWAHRAAECKQILCKAYKYKSAPRLDGVLAAKGSTVAQRPTLGPS